MRESLLLTYSSRIVHIVRERLWEGLNDLFCFFSSRRRHTRCLSDWSSDVCSSDLLADSSGKQRNLDLVAFRTSRRGLFRARRPPRYRRNRNSPSSASLLALTD